MGAMAKKRQEIAQARKDIANLFAMAKEKAHTEPALADRYVKLARKLALKHRISLRQYNRVHCRKCGTYWTGRTLRVRTRPAAVVYSCLACEHTKRYRKT